MAANGTYQVVLMDSRGVKTTVNVFADSSNGAINNAKNQTSPLNSASLKVVSVNSINTCSAPAGNGFVVTNKDINNQGGNNINNY